MQDNLLTTKDAEIALEIFATIAPKILCITPEQRVAFALVRNYWEGRQINIKALESFYSGSRSSFQIFIKKLVEAQVISLTVDKRDRRSKIVSFAPPVQSILNKYFKSPCVLTGSPGADAVVAADGPWNVTGAVPPIRRCETLTCAVDRASCFEVAVAVWRNACSGPQPPALTVELIADLASGVDLRHAHIVDTVGQGAEDFKYSRIGDFGQYEARAMTQNLLSTLPDCQYKREIYHDYRLSLLESVPLFRKINTSNPIVNAEYDRLILPFSTNDVGAKRLIIIIDHVRISN